MAGRCPKSLEHQFIADVQAGLTNRQLAEKYGRVARTIRSWKRQLRKSGDLLTYQPDIAPSQFVTFEEEGNCAEANSTSERIKTLEQLLDAAEVDLAIWQVRDWGVKKWEVGAKIKKGHLEWEQGKIDGYLNYEGLGVEDLWSVWAKFIRREPLFVQPAIQPVQCPVTYQKPPRPSKAGAKLALVGADAHFGYRQEYAGAQLQPFHDRRALSVFLQLAAYLQPDLIKLLGDWNDLPEATDKFVRSPDMRALMQPAIEEGHWYRRQLREACPDSRIEEHQGNHEARIPKFMASHCEWALGLKRADQVELGPVLTLPYLLALDALGIVWIDSYPDDLAWINDELMTYHGEITSTIPANAASKIVREMEYSCLFGHGHSRQAASVTKRARGAVRTIEARGIGCLCRIDEGGPPAKSYRNDWQNSVAIVEYDDIDFNIYDLEIRNGNLLWAGQRFMGEDYRDQLQEDLPSWNW